MAIEIKTTFLLKRGTSARWQEINPVLQQGEPGFEIDTGLLKIGDGLTAWADLKYTNHFIFNAETKDQLPPKGDARFLYKVISEKCLYQWNASLSLYESLGNKDLPLASDSTPGAMKLYNTLGDKQDGTISQATITTELQNKVEAALDPGQELLILKI